MPNVSQFPRDGRDAPARGARHQPVGEGVPRRDGEVGWLRTDRDRRPRITRKRPVVLKLRRHPELIARGAHCQPQIDGRDVRLERDRLDLAVEEPIDPVGAAVAHERIARATQPQPKIRKEHPRAVAPGGPAGVPRQLRRPLGELAERPASFSDRPRIEANQRARAERLKRNARVNPGLGRESNRIHVWNLHLHVEITRLRRISVVERIPAAEDIHPAPKEDELPRTEAVVLARRRRNQRIHIVANQTRHRTGGRIRPAERPARKVLHAGDRHRERSRDDAGRRQNNINPIRPLRRQAGPIDPRLHRVHPIDRVVCGIFGRRCIHRLIKLHTHRRPIDAARRHHRQSLRSDRQRGRVARNRVSRAAHHHTHLRAVVCRERGRGDIIPRSGQRNVRPSPAAI